MRTKLFRFFIFAVLLWVISGAFAAGTPEGTVIMNWGWIHYSDSRHVITYSDFSDTTRIIMGFSASVEVLPESLMNTAYLETQSSFSHFLYNRGNGVDTLDLSAVSSHGWTVTLYFDTDMDGSPSGEPLYTPQHLDADDSIAVIAVVSVGDLKEFWANIDTMLLILSSRRNPLFLIPPKTLHG
jgi:hypothetical protein